MFNFNNVENPFFAESGETDLASLKSVCANVYGEIVDFLRAAKTIEQLHLVVSSEKCFLIFQDLFSMKAAIGLPQGKLQETAFITVCRVSDSAARDHGLNCTLAWYSVCQRTELASLQNNNTFIAG